MERSERKIKPLLNKPTKGIFDKNEEFIKVYDEIDKIYYYTRAKEIKSIAVFDNELKAILYERNQVVVVVNPNEIEPLLSKQEFDLIMEELERNKNHG